MCGSIQSQTGHGYCTAMPLITERVNTAAAPPPLPPTEAAQATETAPAADLAAEQNTPENVPQNPSVNSVPPTSLPESLWSPVTNKGTEAFRVETQALPSDQMTQPVVLEVKNLDAVPRTVQVVIREKKP